MMVINTAYREPTSHHLSYVDNLYYKKSRVSPSVRPSVRPSHSAVITLGKNLSNNVNKTELNIMELGFIQNIM